MADEQMDGRTHGQLDIGKTTSLNLWREIISNELNFSDVYPSVNYIVWLAKCT